MAPRTISPAQGLANTNTEVPSKPVRQSRSARPTTVVADRKLTRREKTHIYARNARLRKKAEHERLRASKEYLTRSNEELRRRNRLMERMLQDARNQVAEATDGFRHFSSVFGYGACADARARARAKKNAEDAVRESICA